MEMMAINGSTTTSISTSRGGGGAAAGITYWFAEHPAIVGFRWSHTHSFGSTWSFLVEFLILYALAAASLNLLLRLLRLHQPLPLGPLLALHSLAMSLSSASIFLGMLLSVTAEIRDTRWSWRGRSPTTPLRWLLCFPPGTRPSGRVFFWSYAFYLSRFLHLLRTFLHILRRRPRTLSGVFRHSARVCMSFLWLEFSQSFQVVVILYSTLMQAVVFGHRFWVGVGLPAAFRSGPLLMLGFQATLTGCNLICHFAVLLLHFAKGGGCNGIGAWVFNSVLNAALLLLFVDKTTAAKKEKKGEVLEEAAGGGKKQYSSQ